MLDPSYDRVVRLLYVRVIVASSRRAGKSRLGISSTIRRYRSNRSNLPVLLPFSPVVAGCLDSEIDKVIGDIVALGTFVTNLFEMLRGTFGFSRIYQLSLRQQQESIEECNDVGLGLMNRKDDCSVVRLGEIFKRFDDIVSVV